MQADASKILSSSGTGYEMHMLCVSPAAAFTYVHTVGRLAPEECWSCEEGWPILITPPARQCFSLSLRLVRASLAGILAHRSEFVSTIHIIDVGMEEAELVCG